MLKSKFNLILIVAVVAILGLIFWSYNNENLDNSDVGGEETMLSGEVIYFYGEECPHCQDIAEFLEENNISEKVEFAKKEVWHNKDNQKEFKRALEVCGIDPSQAGVPLLYVRGECLIGGPEVEGFFKKEAGIE